MPEFFEITAIIPKKGKKDFIRKVKQKLNIVKGENKFDTTFSAIQNKVVIFDFFEYREKDYLEFTFSFIIPKFSKEDFKHEIDSMQVFVDMLFTLCSKLEFVLCCYEMTYDLISHVNSYSSFG